MLDINELNPDIIEAIRALHSAGIKPPTQAVNIVKTGHMNVCDHAERTFYTPDTGKLIHLEPFQKIFLNIAAGSHNYPNILPFYSTIYMTSVKKTGKTSLSGCYAKWRAESPVFNDEILFIANDETQSRGRAYAAIQRAIEMHPLFDRVKRILVDDDGNVIWRIIEDYIEHIPTSTKVKAINVDYRGESGANPSLTVYTEVWGFDSDKQEKLYDEMTPVLTRVKSQRYLEGYAGYTGKSRIQERVEGLATDPDKGARRLTRDDIPDWPFSEEYEYELPLFINNEAGVFALVDRGVVARQRMPWNIGPEADRYYAEQAQTLAPEQFERLHNNQWVSPVTAFIPIEWWNQCAEHDLPELKQWRIPTLDPPDWWFIDGGIKGYRDITNWQIVNEATPVVLAVDASVVGDCTAVVMITRHPGRHTDVALRGAWVWNPKGNKLDYENTPASAPYALPLKWLLIDLCLKYNVVEIAYDNWQLHHMMTQLSNEGITWCREFSQAGPRGVADKQLYDLIKGKKIAYNSSNELICHADIRRHILGAARSQSAKEDTRMRIQKSADDSKIDLVVAMSMASAECLRLDL